MERLPPPRANASLTAVPTPAACRVGLTKRIHDTASGEGTTARAPLLAWTCTDRVQTERALGRAHLPPAGSTGAAGSAAGLAAAGRSAADLQGGGRQAGDQPEHGAEGVSGARSRRAGRGATRAGHVRLARAHTGRAGRARGAASRAVAVGQTARRQPGSTRKASPRSSPPRFRPRFSRRRHDAHSGCPDTESREALRVALGTARVLVGDSDRVGHGPRRAKRRGQDDASAPRDRSQRAERRRGTRASISVAPGSSMRAASSGCRTAGCPILRSWRHARMWRRAGASTQRVWPSTTS